MSRRVAILWVAFLSAHALTAGLGWVYPSQPMGDVVLVYEPWATSALTGGTVMGITEPWVYPQLALVPMMLAKALSLPLVASIRILSSDSAPDSSACRTIPSAGRSFTEPPGFANSSFR